MGHRKHSAPRRGSLAFRPRARARSMLPRVRVWPNVESEKPTLLGFPTFKAGAIHVITVDDREKTPNFGKPLFNLATVLAAPMVEVKGLRIYGTENGNEVVLSETYSEPNDLISKTKLDDVRRVTAVCSVTPREVGLSQKRPIKIELGVGGGDTKSRLEYAASILGKKIRFSDIFKAGMYVDVLGITKGQGFEGPVTRFGVKRKQHKSRKSVRAIGVLGPWHPAAVMYTAPRAGQMGFHQRTETGKRVIFVGNAKDMPVTPKGGFLHFGEVRGDYVVLRGSVPGPARRFALVRYPTRTRPRRLTPPQVIEVSTRVGQ